VSLNSEPNAVQPLVVEGAVWAGHSGRAERDTLLALVIACYVVCIAGVYAPWFRLGIEVARPGSPARTFWDSGISNWGSGNALVVLALLGVGVTIWCTVHRGSRLASSVPSFFLALFVVAARQILAYGEIYSGWHWSSLTREVGWGLTLILITSGVGCVVSLRWLFVTPRETAGEGVERGQREASFAAQSAKYLQALVVLTLLVIAFSQATWLNIQEDVGRTVRLTYRGDAHFGAGFVTVVIGLVLLLVCVGQLLAPGRRSPAVPSALVVANVLALANYYVAFTCPPYIHGEILFRLQWGFFVTLGATFLSVLFLVGWWRVERAPRGTLTDPPRPPSE
jgi:hypothetical protein